MLGKVCTVNVPESFLPAMEKLSGHGKLYESRSELVRKALLDELREYLQILETLKNRIRASIPKPVILPANIIQIRDKDENGEITNITEYKVLRKLE